MMRLSMLPITREEIRWRAIAWIEGLTVLGLLFLAAFSGSVLLGTVILIAGLFGSGIVWLVVLRILRVRPDRPLTARKAPKAP